MEDEDDVEGAELVAGDGEGEADEDGVEDDAELEDEDGRHLGRVVLDPFAAVGVLGFHIIVAVGVVMVVILVRAVVAEVVVAGGAGGDDARFALRLGGGVAVLEFVGGGGGGVGAVEGGVAHGHELGEEEEEDGHQGDPLNPRVVCDGPSETFISEGFVGGSEEVDEGGCDDDAGAEVFGDEEGPWGDADAFVASGIDGKCSA